MASLRQRWAILYLLILPVLYVILNSVYNTAQKDTLKTIQMLQTKEHLQTILVSDFLRRNLPESALSTDGESARLQERDITPPAQISLYKRSFSRPKANPSPLNSSSHPYFPGFTIENPNLCAASKERVDVLVYIHSAVQNAARRRAIRHSWASRYAFTGLAVRLVFILGQPPSRREQLKILSEQASSGDIVQARFEDTFRNLTFKAVTYLAWANAHCAQAQYVVKVDDDMFVDMFRVLSDVIPKMADKSYTMACAYKPEEEINRNPNNHWFVNSTLLAGQTHYPGYCPGFFSVFTGNVIPKLYEASFLVKDFIPVDDVYMTGLAAKHLTNVTIVNLKGQLTPNERSDPDQEIKVNGHFEYIAFRVKREEEHENLWNIRLSKLNDLEWKLSSHRNLFDGYGKNAVEIKN